MNLQEFLLDTIRFTILFLASSIIPGYVLRINLKYLYYLTIFTLMLLLMSMFFPLFKVGDVDSSIWNYILEGSNAYAVMLACYLLTLIAVFTRMKKIVFYAGFVFLIGFIFAYGGLFYLGDKVINQAISENRWETISWLLLYYVAPLIALVFYIPYTHRLTKN